MLDRLLGMALMIPGGGEGLKVGGEVKSRKVH